MITYLGFSPEQNGLHFDFGYVHPALIFGPLVNG